MTPTLEQRKAAALEVFESIITNVEIKYGAMKALEALNKTIDLVDHDSGEPIPTPFKNFLSDDVYETIRTALQKSAQVDGLVAALKLISYAEPVGSKARLTAEEALQQFSAKDKSK